MLPIYELEQTDSGADVTVTLKGKDGNNAPYGTDTTAVFVGGAHTDVTIDSNDKIEVSSTASRLWEGDTPPSDSDVQPRDFWYNSVDGRLYVYYTNGSADPVWVDASPSAIDGSDYVQKRGDTILGDIAFEAKTDGSASHSLLCYHYNLSDLPKVPARSL